MIEATNREEGMGQTNGELASAIVEQSPDAVIYAGPDGIIKVWNDAASGMFGFTAAEAIGKDLNIIIPEQFQETHWKGFDRALAAGETKYKGKALPTKALKAGGETFYVELSFAIIKDAAGKPIGALAHARDITEKFEQDRASRRQLRELEAELKSLREASGAAAS